MFGEPELLADGVEGGGHLGQVAGGALASSGAQTSVSHLQKYLKVSKNIYCCYYCELPLHLDDGNVPVSLGLEHLLLADLVITHAPVPWR